MTRQKQLADAINDFIVGCKSDGIWEPIKACCILAGWNNLSGCLVPLKGAAPTNNNFVSGDYDRETGLVGDGSTKYLDSNRANDADPQDDNHVAAYLSSGVTTADGNIWGTDGVAVAGGNNIYRANTGGFPLGGANRGTGSGSAFIIPGQGGSTGFKGYSRAASAGYTVRTGSSDTTVTSASSAPTARSVFFFARNDASNPPLFLSDPRLAFYSIGESIDLAALDTRVSNLITAIGAAI